MALTCPYCGEQNTAMGLRGHITINDDEDHGPLGQVPEDFEETEAGREVVEHETSRRAMFQTGMEGDREESEERGGILGRIFGGS